MTSEDQQDLETGHIGEVIPFPTRQTVDQAPEVHQPGEELATRDASEVAEPEKVYDAELVDDEPGTAVGPVRRVVQPVVKVVMPVIIVVRQARQHEPTVRSSKWLLRQLVYVFAGLGVLLKRLWDAKTNSPYQRAMRAAEAAGDWERWSDVEQRGAKAFTDRHRRRMDGPKLLLQRLVAIGIAVPVVGVFLLLIGVAVAKAADDWTLVWGPLQGTVAAVGWLATTVMWLVSAFAFLLPFLVVGLTWNVGRRAEVARGWLAPAGGRGDMMTSVLTEDTITAALRGTVPDFDRAVKGGWQVRYRIPPREAEGGGTHFQIDLPPRAPVEAFVKNKKLLAHNLKRFPIEVWPTEPIAGVLDGWVADPGVLTKPVGPWPVLKDLDNARCDYFRGIPVAMTLRGQVVASPLSQKNYFMAGIMGSGKTSMALTLALGAILDPLVDVDVVVMAENGDFEPLRPALRSLHTGAGEGTVEAAIQLLRNRFRDLGELGELLREQMDITAAQGREPDKFICREYAEREPRLRPRVMIIDECQNLFMSEHGKDAETIVKKLVTTARKYATTLIMLTPDPTGDAVPSGVVRIMSNRACFPIGDQIGNDAAIGTGSHKTGLTAANLVPAIDDQLNDAGTCAARGFTNPPGMLRCFYVPQSDAHRVTKRALQLRGNPRRLLAAAPVREKRDLLADVGEVIGQQTVPAADIPALLSRAFPNQVLYQQMTGKQLRDLLLKEHGVRVPKTGNRFPVSPKLIADGLARRRELSYEADDDAPPF